MPCECVVDDKIMLKTESKTKYGEAPCVGLCFIVQVNNNEAVKFKKNNLLDIICIYQIHPKKGLVSCR